MNSHDEFISITLESNDRFGSSSLTIEGLTYEDAWEEIRNYLNFIFQTERFVDITINIEVREETRKNISRKLNKINYSRAKDAIAEFLKYVYKVEEEMLFKPMTSGVGTLYGDSSWLSGYDLENLTQKEKVFLLLKYNHPGQWVRSQELQKEYEIVYGEGIKLSSLSTYLARFYEKGTLERRGTRAQREYMLTTSADVLNL